MVGIMPMTASPLSSPFSAATSSLSCEALCRVTRAWAMIFSPSAVGRTGCAPRSNMLTSRAVSMLRMPALRVGWVTPQASARSGSDWPQPVQEELWIWQLSRLPGRMSRRPAFVLCWNSLFLSGTVSGQLRVMCYVCSLHQILCRVHSGFDLSTGKYIEIFDNNIKIIDLIYKNCRRIFAT